MFTVRNIHIAADARPFSSRFSLCSSFIAISPAGVAAHPSPRKFATKFVAIYFLAGCSRGTEGKRKSISGVSLAASRSIIPPRSAIFSTPDQTEITPAMASASSTAERPPLKIAPVTISILPRNAPVRIPPIKKKPQMPFNISASPLSLVYVCFLSLMNLFSPQKNCSKKLRIFFKKCDFC